MRKAFSQESVERESSRFHSFPDFPDDASVVRGSDEKAADAFRKMETDSRTGPSEADRIRQAADLVKKQARDAGLAEGFEKGKQAVTAELDHVIQKLHQAYMNIEKFRKQLYLNAETDTVELAVAVARVIIGQEISIDREIVLNVVKEALGKVVDHEKIKIRINPSDLEIVKTALFQFLPLVENLENINFEADAAMSAGGCTVETNFGNIDARIENQLKQITESFAAELEKSKYSK